MTLDDETPTGTDATSAADAGPIDQAAAPPAKRTARKRATRKTAAPAQTDPSADQAATDQVATDDAGAAADGQGADAKPARKRAAKKTAKRTTRKTAATSGSADQPERATDQQPDEPQPDATEQAASAEQQEQAEPAKAPRARRSRKKAAAAPQDDAGQNDVQQVAAQIVADVVQQVTGEPADETDEDETSETDETDETDETSEVGETGETVGTAPALAPLFQVPDVAAAPRRRRAASRPAGPPQAAEDTADASAGDAGSAPAEDLGRQQEPTGDDQQEAPARSGRSRRRRGRGAAEKDAPQDGTPETTQDAPEDSTRDRDAEPSADGTGPADGDADDAGDDDQGGARRRRRRGGRGRRRRGGDEDAETTDGGDDRDPDESRSGSGSGSGSDEAGSDEAEGEDTEQTGDRADDSGSQDGDEGGSRRRRRRRRRAGGGDDASGEDDPPNTVTRVRQSRSGSARDEVTGVRGSTRLEAKRQRRREGRESGRRKQVITESEFLARREAVARTMLVREVEGRTQIVVLEDGVLVEHYVARKAAASMIGNVYVGKVQNVLPSMEAAFVDIGKGRNAVLYAGEVNWDAAGLEGQPRRIELALKSGDPVLVQVSKDPAGHKGARLTSQVSLPGRYLVYVPNSSMTGISRKLPDKERARLKKILKAVVPDHAGVIVRTAAEGASEVELERDVQRLQKLWEAIEKRSKAANPPNLLHGEPDLTIKVVRDVFNEDFGSLVVSGEEAWETVKGYVDEVAPDLSERVSRWDGDGDVFAAHQVDEQIAKALERKVFLPSGGSLVIDRTEAMTVVDVNTGKFVGSGGNLEETVTRNNLEAAEEIVRQLRLRDVGGIIVIDFIDMVLESNRDLVLRRLTECLGRDRTKHQVAEVTSLGLVQMTRKRVGQGLLEAFSEPCEHCHGSGVTLFDEPVERKGDGGGGGGGGRGGEGKGGRGGGRNQNGQGGQNGAQAKPADDALTEAQREQQRRASAEAQKVHEAARKAMERAKEKEAAVADATVAAEQGAEPAAEHAAEQVAEQAVEQEALDAGGAPSATPEPEPQPEPEPEPQPEPQPEVRVEADPVVEPESALEQAPAEPVTPPKRRRRRATSPTTAPAAAPAPDQPTG